jgi:Polyketide cyclase / dehydrase and lipid transport
VRALGGRSTFDDDDPPGPLIVVHVNGSITIHRPVETVFDYVADQSNEPAYNPRMATSERINDGPVGVGTRFHATVLTRRRPLDMDIEVTESDRPTRFGTHTTMASANVTGVLTFRPIGADTQMSWSWDIRPQGMARLFSPLVALIGRHQEKACWAGLKRVLEAGAPQQI